MRGMGCQKCTTTGGAVGLIPSGCTSKALTRGRYRRACMCRCARCGGACPVCPQPGALCWQGEGGTSGHTMGRCLAQLLHARLLLGGPGGGAFNAGAHLCRSPAGRGWRVWGGCVCPVLRAPAAGHGCSTTWLLRESVGQVTGSFLQPTTKPQRGARGVWSEVKGGEGRSEGRGEGVLAGNPFLQGSRYGPCRRCAKKF